jgi:sugar/nucleoside kinase (ribokinase family)
MSEHASAPDYLVIGHITADVVPGGTTPGGTALFAARTAARLGLRTAIVTSAPADYVAALAPQLAGIAVHNRPSAQPSTFANIYQDGHRTQFLRARAHTLTPHDIPPAWRDSAIVHFGPVDDEVDRALLKPGRFPAALRGATPQGWLRSWGADGRVHTARGAAAAALMPALPVLVFSEEDIERDAGVVAACRALCDVVAVTAGSQGATIYQGEHAHHFPAFPTHEVDPTGAGDVFAAAFLARYRAGGDLITAGRYASVAASFIVEAPGADGIPTAEQTADRFRRYEEWLVASGQ